LISYENRQYWMTSRKKFRSSLKNSKFGLNFYQSVNSLRQTFNRFEKMKRSLPNVSFSSSSDDEDEVVAAATLSYLQYLNLVENEERNARQYRTYITRASLLPNPRSETPWHVLYESKIDRSLIVTTGLDFGSFESLMDIGFAETCNNTFIPRNDVSATGRVRLGRKSLDAAGVLGLCLHYLNSSMTEVTLQEIFALTPAVTSR
jgi:hypothetical protein